LAFDVPAEIIISVIEHESNYKITAKSSESCVGLMQLAPNTARKLVKELGLNKPKDFNDSEINILLGSFLLSKLKGQLGSWGKILTAYNKGIGAWFIKPKVNNYAHSVIDESLLIREEIL
jgi:soluble lytic murein transglycosylase